MLLSLLCLLWLIPPAESTWTVHVVARGGFSGNVSQDLTVASDGKINCLVPQTPCPKQPDVSKLKALIEMLPEQSVSITHPVPPNVFCNDCLTRTIVIERRDSSGTTNSYSAQWTDVNANGVPPTILQIYDAVIALQRVIAR